jgi:membrane protease YdiL (CAAX protease family)
MMIGTETGIGPTIRVLRHLTEGQRFYRLRFENGERALLLIAGIPAPSVELVRLTLGGVVPSQSVWQYNVMRAGGYGEYVQKVKAMFSRTTDSSDGSFRFIRDALLCCGSINEARTLLLERERLADSSTTGFADEITEREPTLVTSNDAWELGGLSHPDGLSRERVDILAVPERYRIRNDGRVKVLSCVEAPRVMVRAEPGVVTRAKQARKYAAGTIFLDGAAEGEPFVDVQKDLYSLDHRQACFRSLATCEQAIVMIRKTLDLRKRDWTIIANDADLDTVFALWVLLNHVRLNEDSEVRAKIMPLLRLEGVIHAHGIDAQDLSALPPDLLDSTFTRLKQLQQHELTFERSGNWPVDLLQYIADRLRAIDELIYSPEDFQGLHEIDELARAEIVDGSVAVACRSDAGIDQVERQLRRIYGSALGLLIFQTGASTYNIRQVDRALPGKLEGAYDRLNLLDPGIRRAFHKKWGGTADTGASPDGTGTRLSPPQIVTAVCEAYRQPTIVDVVSQMPKAVFFAVVGLLPALAVIFVGNLLRVRGYAVETALLSAVSLSIMVGILFWLKVRRVGGVYGWRAPKDFGWLAVLPAGFVGASIGGVWAPASLSYRMGFLAEYDFPISAALLFSVGAELLFRGVILGHLASRLPLQTSGGPWSGSWPTFISAALYAAASVVLFVSLSGGELQITQWSLILAGGFIFGVASGIARERSESILCSVLLHLTCAAALLLSRFVL